MYIRNARGLAVAAGLLTAVPALAQQTGVAGESPAVTMEAARKVALAKVPGGKVQDEELERENGRLVYSFEISAPGQSGAREVLVGADDGRVVSVKEEAEHQDDLEGESDEAEERDAGPESGGDK